MYTGLVNVSWWGYVIVALVLTHITIASVTIFLHRHQAHRALDLHPIASHFFRFWLWLTTGMVTKEWAAVHRKHHAKCETLEDPHSPQILGIWHILFGGVFYYVKESRNKQTIERYGHLTPDDWLERHVYTPLQKVGVVVMLAIDIALFGAVPGALIWTVQMIWIPFFAAGVINGIGHYWGYRNADTPDKSTNIVPWGMLIGGEELHNNHHAYPSSARLSVKWYEVDIGWWYIRLLQSIGLARVKKVPPMIVFDPAKTVPDHGTIEAIVAGRYVILAYFDKIVKRDPESEKEMLRRHLTALWQRSTLSASQWLEQLSVWHGQAIMSRNQKLREFARALLGCRLA